MEEEWLVAQDKLAQSTRAFRKIEHEKEQMDSELLKTSAVSANYRELKAEKEVLQAQLSALQEEMTANTTSLNATEKERAILRVECDKLEAKVCDLSHDKRNLQREHEELQTEISDLHEHKSRNTSLLADLHHRLSQAQDTRLNAERLKEEKDSVVKALAAAVEKLDTQAEDMRVAAREKETLFRQHSAIEDAHRHCASKLKEVEERAESSERLCASLRRDTKTLQEACTDLKRDLEAERTQLKEATLAHQIVVEKHAVMSPQLVKCEKELAEAKQKLARQGRDMEVMRENVSIHAEGTSELSVVKKALRKSEAALSASSAEVERLQAVDEQRMAAHRAMSEMHAAASAGQADELVRLQGALASARDEKISLSAELETSQAEGERQRARMQMLKEDSAVLTKERDRIAVQLREASSELVQVQGHLSACQEEVALHKRAHERLSDEAVSLRHTGGDLNGKMSALLSELDDVQAAHDRLKRKHATLLKEQDATEEELDRTRGDLQVCKRRAADAEARLEGSKHQHEQSAATARASAIRTETKLKTELENAEATIANLKEQNVQLKASVSEQARAANEMQGRSDGLRATTSDLEQELKNVQSQRDSLSRSHDELVEEHERLSAVYARTHQDLLTTQETLHTMQQTLDSTRAKHNDEISGLEAACSAAELQRQVTSQRCEELRMDSMSRNDDLDDLRAQIKDFTREKVRLQSHTADLENDKELMQQVLAACKAEVRKAEEDAEAQQQVHKQREANAKDEMHALDVAVRDRDRDISRLSRDNDALRAEIKRALGDAEALKIGAQIAHEQRRQGDADERSIADTEHSIAELQASISEYETEARSSGMRAASAAKELERTSSLLAEREATIAKLRNELAEKTRRWEESNKGTEDKDKELSELRNLHAALQKVHDERLEEMEQLSQTQVSFQDLHERGQQDMLDLLAEYNELKEEAKMRKLAHDKLTEEHVSLSEVRHMKESELEAMIGELNEYKDEMGLLSKENIGIKSLHKMKEAEVARLKQLHSSVEQLHREKHVAHAKLHTSHMTLQQLLETKDNEMQELLGDYDVLKAQHVAAVKDKNNLDSEVRKERRLRSDTETKLLHQTEEADRLAQLADEEGRARADSQASFEKASGENFRLKMDLKRVRKEADEFEELLLDTRGEVQTLREDLDHSQKAHAELKDKYNELQRQARELERVKAALTEDLSEACLVRQTLEAELISASKDKDAARKAAEARRGAEKDMRDAHAQELFECERDMEKLRREHADLQRSHEDLRSKLEACKDSVRAAEEHTSSYDEATRNVDKLERAVEEAQRVREKDGRSLERAREELARTLAELEQCRDQLRTSQNELRRCKETLAAGQVPGSMDILRDQLRTTQLEAEELQVHLSNMRKELSAAKLESARTREERDRGKEELDLVCEQLAAARNSNSSPSKRALEFEELREQYLAARAEAARANGALADAQAGNDGDAQHVREEQAALQLKYKDLKASYKKLKSAHKELRNTTLLSPSPERAREKAGAHDLSIRLAEMTTERNQLERRLSPFPSARASRSQAGDQRQRHLSFEHEALREGLDVQLAIAGHLDASLGSPIEELEVENEDLHEHVLDKSRENERRLARNLRRPARPDRATSPVVSRRFGGLLSRASDRGNRDGTTSFSDSSWSRR